MATRTCFQLQEHVRLLVVKVAPAGTSLVHRDDHRVPDTVKVVRFVELELNKFIKRMLISLLLFGIT